MAAVIAGHTLPHGNTLVLISVRNLVELGLLNKDRTKSSVENFYGTQRESNPEYPVLWRIISIRVGK